MTTFHFLLKVLLHTSQHTTLAVPVLAGSAAYAVAEAAGWQGSLSLRLDKGEGRGFYSVIATATLVGVALCFTPTDPVKELFWSAVLNGVIAVPIMAVMMLLASRRDTMGEHVIGHRLRALGWLGHDGHGGHRHGPADYLVSGVQSVQSWLPKLREKPPPPPACAG